MVSIIIPTRNRPALLRAAVASVLGQTRVVDQVVVVDDASDGAEWLPAIEAMSPTLDIVRRQRHGGVSAARNDGLARARGDYLLFLDDDDLIDPELVEAGLERLDADPEVDGVFFRYRTLVSLDAAGEDARLAPATPEHVPRPARFPFLGATNPVPRATLEDRPTSAFIRHLLPIHSGFLRRSAVGDSRFPEGLRQGEDTYFWMTLAAAGRRFLLDDHAYAVVRRHAGNTKRSRSRYRVEIQPCYERLLAEGLLAVPEDIYLAHFKLLLFKLLTREGSVSPHVRHVLGSPRLFAREVRFWTGNLAARLRQLGWESPA